MYRELRAGEGQPWHLYDAAAYIFASMPPLEALEAAVSRLAEANIFPPPSNPAVPDESTADDSPLWELAEWYRRWPRGQWLAPDPCQIVYDPTHDEFVVEGETPTSFRLWTARLCQSERKWELSAFRIRDTSERGSEAAFGRVLNMVLGTHPVPTPYEYVTNRVLVSVSGSRAFLERATPMAVVCLDDCGDGKAFEVCGIRVELA